MYINTLVLLSFRYIFIFYMYANIWSDIMFLISEKSGHLTYCVSVLMDTRYIVTHTAIKMKMLLNKKSLNTKVIENIIDTHNNEIAINFAFNGIPFPSS